MTGKLLSLLVALVLGIHCRAQYNYTVALSAEEITARIQGEGVTILNPRIDCWDTAYAWYEGLGAMGIDTGLMISNSYAYKIFDTFTKFLIHSWGPNGNQVELPYTDTLDSLYFRPLMASWGNPRNSNRVFYSCSYEFDIVPTGSSIEFKYVFAEGLLDSAWGSGVAEYYILAPRCQCFLRAHIIGIFVVGPGYEDTVNFAVFPADNPTDRTDIPVNGYTLNLNPEDFEHFCNHPMGWFDHPYNPEEDTMLWSSYIPKKEYIRYNKNGYRDSNINFPGFTRPMDVGILVNPCDTYHMVMAVGHVHQLYDTFYNEDWGGWWVVPCDHGHLYNNKGTAMFIDKIRSTGISVESCEDPEGIGSLPGLRGVRLYPNPFNTDLRFTAPYADRQYQLQVTDVMGRRIGILTGTAQEIEHQLNKTIHPGLGSGQLYLFIIRDLHSGAYTTIKLRKE